MMLSCGRLSFNGSSPAKHGAFPSILDETRRSFAVSGYYKSKLRLQRSINTVLTQLLRSRSAAGNPKLERGV